MSKTNYVISREVSVKYRFPNDYGASVVQNAHSYGGEEGFYEIAVLKYHSDNNDDHTVDYETPVTNDVIGWVHTDDIDKHLAKIESL
jgi:hypothetical protein|tara:strand:- start:1201 stop:1461 length:261 start_codon:yes stop_codon:yes gene_type:complete